MSERCCSIDAHSGLLTSNYISLSDTYYGHVYIIDYILVNYYYCKLFYLFFYIINQSILTFLRLMYAAL
jgi:hypothetical protein